MEETIKLIISMIKDKHDDIKKQIRKLEIQFEKIRIPEKRKSLRNKLLEYDIQRQTYVDIINMLQDLLENPSEVQK